MLVDSHCHLDYLERDQDLDAIVGRARDAGVVKLLTISTRLSEFETVHGIAARYPDVVCSVGVHPHEADREGQETPRRLIDLTAREKVVGIGETGLDYYYENATPEAQKRSFRAHIAAARETGLPLIVHARDADEDTIGILRSEYAEGPFTGVLHCFTAGRALAEAALEIGFCISMAGIVTFKSASALREIVRNVPLDHLLIETDSPFLAPVPMRGKTNEPAFVAHTATFLAGELGIEEAALAKATTDNFFRLFGKAPRP